MKRLLALFAILIPIYLFAQGFGSFSHDQPFLAKDNVASSGPSLPVNVAYRWEDLLLATNTIITNWLDSVYGLRATNASASSPTRDTNGLYFSGTKSLSVIDNLILDTNANTICFFYNADSASAPVWGPLAGESTAAYGYLLEANQTVLHQRGSGIEDTLSTTIVRNAMVDIEISQNSIYTNGVFSATRTAMPHQFIYFGRDSGGDVFKGYIRAVLVWTNAALSASDAFIVHQYRTNFYGQ